MCCPLRDHAGKVAILSQAVAGCGRFSDVIIKQGLAVWKPMFVPQRAAFKEFIRLVQKGTKVC